MAIETAAQSRLPTTARMCARPAVLCWIALLILLNACGGGAGGASPAAFPAAGAATSGTDAGSQAGAPEQAEPHGPQEDPDQQLRRLLAENGVAAPARAQVPDALYSLGLNLFQSTLLSGNRQVSCASCHATGNAGLDNLALGIGVGGSGRGSARTGTPVIHRNTPALVNMGVGGRTSMFWDGRVSIEDGTFKTPAGSALPTGLKDIVAAQSLFPLLSRTEMLGDADPGDDNTLADLVAQDQPVEGNPTPVWNALMQHLRDDAGIAAQLQAAYPDTPLPAMGIEHAANALSAFQARRWYALGESNQLLGYAAGTRSLAEGARRGGLLFFGKAQCMQCHNGPLLSDQQFHNLAMPQMGPGFGSGAAQAPPRDNGRYEVTGRQEDLYAFRTPSLWEVKNTFPYGHAGAYDTLEQVVRHHLDAAAAALAFRCPDGANVAGSPIACQDSLNAPQLYADMVARLDARMRTPLALTDGEVADLVAFLSTMSDGNNASVR